MNRYNIWDLSFDLLTVLSCGMQSQRKFVRTCFSSAQSHPLTSSAPGRAQIPQNLEKVAEWWLKREIRRNDLQPP